jgi:hypothetical protein
VEEERALRGALDIDELELLKVVGGVGREQPLAVPGHRGRDHESQLVDQPGRDERPGELGAAVDPDVAARPLLQVSNVVSDRSRDPDCVVPVPGEIGRRGVCFARRLMNEANGSTSDVGQ